MNVGALVEKKSRLASEARGSLVVFDKRVRQMARSDPHTITVAHTHTNMSLLDLPFEIIARIAAFCICMDGGHDLRLSCKTFRKAVDSVKRSIVNYIGDLNVHRNHRFVYPLRVRTALNMAAIHGYSHTCEIIIDRVNSPSAKKIHGVTAMALAARFDRVKVVDMLWSKFRFPHTNFVTEAAKYNAISVFKWLDSNGPKRIEHEKVARIAVLRGHLEVLKWALPHVIGTLHRLFILASINGHLHIVVHLYENHYASMWRPDEALYDSSVFAARKGHVNILEYFKAKGYSTPDVYREAIERNQSLVLAWAIKSVPFDKDIYDLALPSTLECIQSMGRT
jgi:hypothetical protein